jgi:antitoxin component of RelBE/YafQ-DinJ toxin-antitoxin module
MESPDNRTRATVRVDSDLLDEYDEVADERGLSRSEAIRQHMRRTVEDAELSDREMPDHDDLAAAYRALLRLTRGGGWVSKERASRRLAEQMPGVDAKGAYGDLIKPLRRKGYLAQQVSSDGRKVSIGVRA